MNESQRRLAIEKAKKALGDLKGKQMGILGLAFKPNTDDVREAVSIKIIERLLREGAEVRAYDPTAIRNTRRDLGERASFARTAYKVDFSSPS